MTAHAAVALLCATTLSCSQADSGASVSGLDGVWDGVIGDPSDGTLLMAPAGFVFTQRGDRVVGTIGYERIGTPEVALEGTFDRGTLSFTLAYDFGCAVALEGTGRLERRSDRDRLNLAYHGAGCGGALAGTARLDRMRCPGATSACVAGLSPDYTPWCADLSNDPGNCGVCGVRCDGDLQVCASGQCQVPACTGPVPLEAPRSTGTGAFAWALVLGDVDGDGDADAFLSGGIGADSWPSVMYAIVPLRNDAGRLSALSPVDLAALFPGEPIAIPSALAVGDLDGDGRLDLAAYAGAEDDPGTLGAGGALLTLLGDGDGTFRAGERFPTGPDEGLMYLGTRVVAVADLDGDGIADVAARSGNAPEVQVRLGVRGGSLAPRSAYALVDPVEALAAADLDGDGALDLAVASDSWHAGAEWRRVSVLLGSGDGTFGAPVESAGVASPQDLAVADLDEDGVPDLVVVSWWSYADHGTPNVSVLLGNGDGTFQRPVPIEEEPWSFTWSLAVADLDRDGHRDLAVGDDERGLELFLGRGDGTFARFEHPVFGGAGLVAAGDADGDGSIDLVTGNEGGRATVDLLRACAP